MPNIHTKKEELQLTCPKLNDLPLVPHHPGEVRKVYTSISIKVRNCIIKSHQPAIFLEEFKSPYGRVRNRVEKTIKQESELAH